MRGRYSISEYWMDGRVNSIKSRKRLFSGRFQIYFASISFGYDINISAWKWASLLNIAHFKILTEASTIFFKF
jgi:hypothetical protein